MLLDEKRLLNLYDEILNVVKSRTATWNSVDELLSGIEKVSRKPNFTFSDNFTEAVNIVRRCMKMVTDSKVTTKALDVPESSLFNVIMGSARVTPLSPSDYTGNIEKTKLTEKELDELKDDVLEAVKEAKYSFEAHVEEISRHAFDFLKPHDKVLIWGYSELTSSFVQSAIDSKSRKTPITLLVSGPKGEALRVQKMLEKHTESKVLHINIIGDGGFFSVMPIVQKVLIPVTALLPDGNLRAPGGTRAICLAARAHSVPGTCSTLCATAFIH